jgi:predicted O-linked N-acetylglucosamine transferase (SPINDLY family)
MNSHIESTLEYWFPLAEQGDAVACYNVGVILQSQSNIQSAIDYYQKAIHLNPELVEAYNNVGGIYKTNGQLDEALKYYLRALHIKPNVADINNNIGVILQTQQNFKEAIRFFNKALSLEPDNATIYYNLGLIFEQQKKLSDAADCHEKAFLLDPQFVLAYWSSQMATIQQLCLKSNVVEQAIKKTKKLLSWAKENNVKGECVVGYSLPFYLTYQEANHRDFLSVCGDACVDLMHYLQVDITTPHKAKQKIRIGIISDNLHHHSVWSAVVKGWYQHLDKERFEIYTFSLGDKRDAEYEIAKQQSDVIFEKPADVKQWRDLIIESEIDALIFPAIGMNYKIHQLACLRMAPIQMTSWGHPDTSGLPTIDYYLTGDDFEPIDAQAHYREKLLRLPNLGACYEPLNIESVEFDIKTLEVDQDTRILIAPGKPFKYDAQYDFIFPEIASRTVNTKIIFFKSKPDGLTEDLQQRMAKVFTEKNLDVNDHVIFIPAMRKARFHSLMKKAHVYLDTIGFSGFNTAMQGIECGLPIVTYEGLFMRGRFGSAIVRRLGLSELITYSPAEYIEKVVKLTNDDVYREDIKKRIQERASQLYSDVGVVRCLEEFIRSAVKR